MGRCWEQLVALILMGMVCLIRSVILPFQRAQNMRKRKIHIIITKMVFPIRTRLNGRDHIWHWISCIICPIMMR